MSIRIINRRIWEAAIELAPGIPLQVYLVKGDRFAVWIDSGVKEMFPLLRQAMEKAKVAPSTMQIVLQTHSHHDHIGCNGQLRDLTNCLIAAHPRYAHWHTDFESHFQEFARSFPDLVPDTAELREEVFGFLDREHPVDILIEDQLRIDLGGVRLEAYHFSGHMEAELAWFMPETRTMIFGDVITLMDAPFIHGHVTVEGYRQSLKKIEGLLEALEVEKVLFSHFPPHTREETFSLIERANEYLDRLDTIVLNLIMGHGEITLENLWSEVVDTLEKEKEFRSLATVYAHVRGLIDRDKVRAVERHVYRAVE